MNLIKISMEKYLAQQNPQRRYSWRHSHRAVFGNRNTGYNERMDCRFGEQRY